MAKVLAIDYGEKRVGLALGDEQLKVAMPFEVLENRGRDFILAELKKIFDQEAIYRVVVGLPMGLNNKNSEKTNETRAFILDLKNNFNLPIITEDERLTSRLADKLFLTYKKKYPRDAIAAMVILQSYLDKIK